MLIFLKQKFLNLTLRYTQNGILHMLDRNRRIKPKPERFQACDEKFDVVVSCEERVYDQVIEGNMLYLMIELSDADVLYLFFQ